MDAVAFAGTAMVGLAWAVLAKRGTALEGEARVSTLTAAAKPDRRVFVPGVPESELTLFRVSHIREMFPDMPTFVSPLVHRAWPRNRRNFVEDDDFMVTTQSFRAGGSSRGDAATGTTPAAPSTSVSSDGGDGRVLRRTPSQRTMGGRNSDAIEFGAPEPTHGGTHPATADGDDGGGASIMCKVSSDGGAVGDSGRPAAIPAFATAGPTRVLYHNPATVRAAIATCGGLCPGLNTVIREIVMCLTYVYGVPRGNIFGVPNGYRGFYENEWLTLRPENVSRIHSEGGTVLGSSRGGMDVEKIVDACVTQGINIVFLIGGDGTHRGADLVYRTAVRRQVPLCVACVPKTIDNDIGIIDRSFGFQTAVEQAVRPIECAHTEALSAKNGIGLVKLMGREAGFIALHAALASRDVNLCLIPEAPWRLSKLLAWLEERLTRSTHAVIVVAEGAESMEQKEAAAAIGSGGKAVKTDASGNRILDDVGEYLRAAITAHFKKIGKVCNLKYIDPSYIIRSAPANAADSDLCTSLAFNCVHGAMAGRTGFTVGTVDNVCVWLPVWALTTGKPQRVDINSRLFARLCSSTGQPNLE